MKNKRSTFLIFIILSTLVLAIFFLLNEREESKIEIENLSQKNIINDSISEVKVKKLNAIIDRKNILIDELISNEKNVNGFIIGEKSISVDELLKLANEAFNENQLLKYQVRKDKIFLDYIEESYGVKVVEDNLGKISLELKSDSSIKDFEKKSNDILKKTNNKLNKLSKELDEKIFILNNLQKRYGFKYEVKTENDKVYSSIYITKLDSALWLYPYYKHKIKEDKNGNTYVK